MFTQLGSQEKDAFFSLLDEYFAARPELFHAGDSAKTPETAAPTPSSVVAAQRRALASTLGSASSIVSSLSHRNETSAPPPASAHNSSGSITNLQSVRKFGSNVDTTSTMSVLSSLRGSGKAAPPSAPPIAPPAFAPRKNNFAPPPTRTVAPSAPEPEPEPEAAAEEAGQGEWAEALYDYDSAEPGDLQIRAHQNVWVTNRNTDDWWTGEFEGKTGLFPASYVKVL